MNKMDNDMEAGVRERFIRALVWQIRGVLFGWSLSDLS